MTADTLIYLTSKGGRLVYNLMVLTYRTFSNGFYNSENSDSVRTKNDITDKLKEDSERCQQ